VSGMLFHDSHLYVCMSVCSFDVCVFHYYFILVETSCFVDILNVLLPICQRSSACSSIKDVGQYISWSLGIK
jgi:hypothetical protein